MSRAALKTATATAAVQLHGPTLRSLPDAFGDSANSAVFEEVQALKATTAKLAKMVKLLKKASAAVKRQEWSVAAKTAMQALEIDENDLSATHIVAIALEKAGELPLALTMYERALNVAPNNPEVLHNLGLLAWRMENLPLARSFLARAAAEEPNRADILNNFACTLRDLGQHDDAVEVLRSRLIEAPGETMLWNALGTVVLEQGLFDEAIAFYLEAARLEPTFARALHNVGHALVEVGRLEEAVEWLDKASALHKQRADALETQHARALAYLAMGDLMRGWEGYKARLEPAFAKQTVFACGTAKRWDGSDLTSKDIMLMGEQGLGDEVLFMTAVPDLLKAIGPKGKLHIATEERLIPLVSRTFPSVHVCAHKTVKIHNGVARLPMALASDLENVEFLIPMGEAASHLRPTIERFPTTKGYLKPDAARVAHWKDWLAQNAKGTAVGITWKSLVMSASRAKHYSPFDLWADTLLTPRVSFINLQYGDCAAELIEARERFGVEILQPTGIDLKQDLDDLAALSAALDLVIGPMNATTNIAASVGADVWIVSSAKRAWPMLGTGALPWYPSARVFGGEHFGDWLPVMANVQEALAARASGK